MRMITSLLLVVTLASSGGLAAQTVDAGRGELPVTVPSSYTGDTAAPLIILLHTYGRTGAVQNEYMALSSLADSYGFIMVAPDGTPSRAEGNPQFWDASAACCNWEGAAIDDSAYLSKLIGSVKAEYSIDEKRVFVLGHSNGAFMSYRLAHDHSATIAAIASLAGVDSITSQAPPHPVHVLQIHGTGDTAISYQGAQIQGKAYPGAKQSVENWAAHNGCSATGSFAGMLDLAETLPGIDTTITRYSSGCKPGGSAELWTMIGGEHIPVLSEHFTRLVVEWLLGHPKP